MWNAIIQPVKDLFTTVLYDPILSILIYLSDHLGNLGLAVVVLTIAIHLILYPINLTSIKSAHKMRELQPDIKKIRNKHKDDPMAAHRAQQELFQKHGVSTLGGCLPQLAQMVVFIAVYSVFRNYFQDPNSVASATQFLWFDVTQPDALMILPILVGLSQLLYGVMLLPATDTEAEKILAAETETTEDDKQAEDMTEMASSVQKQMLLVMPIFIGYITHVNPAGLGLYWVLSTVVRTVQQYYVSGWGGLALYYDKLTQRLSSGK